ncbi:MAG TPA: plastocyanin/azurin family copper-binding protein [Frankiaceae bacterium]|jgi:plastocyanin|nr:plastocyanin/azurin family copper-binding protein [Frankiaceae bacterium]
MRRALACAYALLLVAGVGCGGSGGDTKKDGASDAVKTDHVTLPKSYKFEPNVVSVAPGTTVTWTNEDDFPHDVTLLDGTKERKPLSIGKSATITFADKGTFRYQCSIHPQQMKGTVIVE